MKNDFFKLSSKRILFSTMMASALLAVSPQSVFADVNEVQSVMQTGTVKGQVVDANGEPIIGASVLVKGTTNGTITDFDGNFSLNDASKGTLVISYIGYQTQEVPVNGKSLVKVVLKEDTEVLDEVVVVGYGVQKKQTLSGSVTQVKGEDVLKGKATQNVASALQGTIPGLTIQRTSSRPGNESTSITLRGGISVNETEPMIVIDGVEGYSWELSQINPNDIESISVLKDAAAAIYGTKAGAGVILVTTKRGKEGKVKVTYSGSVHANVVGKKFPVATGSEYAQLVVQGMENDIANGNGTAITWRNFDEATWRALANGEKVAGMITNPANGASSYTVFDPTVDMYGAIYGTTWGHDHNLAISGGSDKIKVMTSLGYADDRSLVKVAYDGQKKYNFRTNVDYKINDFLKADFNISYDKRTTSTPTQGVGTGVNQPWLFPIYNEFGQYYDVFGSTNVVAFLKEGGRTENYENIFRLGGKLTLDLNKWIKGLSFTTSANFRIRDHRKKTRQTKVTLYDWQGERASSDGMPVAGANSGSLQYQTAAKDMYVRDNRQSVNYQMYNAFVNYHTTLFNDHNIAVMAGITGEKTSASTLEGYRNGMMYDSLDDINLGDASSVTATGGSNEVGMISYLGRLNYDYKGIYLLEGLFRRDGSSKFHKDNRWANFAGVSGGVRLSELDFMKKLKTFDNLKIRASYGETGSQTGIGNYDYYATIATGTTLLGTVPTKVNTSYKNAMVSLDRTWERIATFNAGLDFAVLNNRLSGTFEWYRRENKGMLISMAYPQMLGASAPKTNSGNFVAKGWELQLNWNDKIGKDFSYNVGFSLSDAKTEITKYDGAVSIACGLNNKVISSSSAGGQIGANPMVASNKPATFIEGKPLNAIYVYKTDGIMQTWDEVHAYYQTINKAGTIAPVEGNVDQLCPGSVKRVDLNNDGRITTDDLYYYGDANPHYLFGINLGASYKGFDFSMFIQGVGKQDVVREGSLSSPFNAWYTNQNGAFTGKTWTESNPNAEFPIISMFQGSRNNWNYKQYNDINIVHTWYARAKNICLGYTLPTAWVKKASLEKVRFYLSADNLFEVCNVPDGFDPEAKAASGNNNVDVYARTITFGVDLTF